MIDNLVFLFSQIEFWIFFLMCMALLPILMYVRRFYPDSVREKMQREEACTLEVNQKPEMKRLRKIVFIGLVLSVVISYILAYYLLPVMQTQFKMFVNISIGSTSLVAGYSMLSEYKINKDKNCNDKIVGYKFIKWFSIFSLIGLCIMIIIVAWNEFK